MSNDSNPSADLIRAARVRFNQAIAEKDVETIRSLLASTYHIVTGRSTQNHGADEEAKRWADVFQQDSTAIYVRTPREFHINESWGLAEELGNWKGNYTADHMLVSASGVYAAKWQRALDGQWVLQVEVFTTMQCDGPDSGCVPPDPIYL
jgi:ketosteroid isomerase-like protein